MDARAKARRGLLDQHAALVDWAREYRRMGIRDGVHRALQLAAQIRISLLEEWTTDQMIAGRGLGAHPWDCTCGVCFRAYVQTVWEGPSGYAPLIYRDWLDATLAERREVRLEAEMRRRPRYTVGRVPMGRGWGVYDNRPDPVFPDDENAPPEYRHWHSTDYGWRGEAQGVADRLNARS
ncbi:hypothetical protein [Saccharothrix sp. HUAS TT1]|uniref:hypothetical protein n=1 Tax=unclassified Saccharothrix TaxID=2593673 RepID=UPI00345B54E6